MPTFAVSTPHITGTGGQSISTLKEGETIPFKTFKNPGIHTGQVINQAGYTYYSNIHSSEGVTTNKYVKITDSKDDSFSIKYPEYLKVGNKIYDVVLKVTSHSFEGNALYVIVDDHIPKFAVNMMYYDSNEQPAFNMNSKDLTGSYDIGWTVEIYETGTNTLAKIPQIRMSLEDLDASLGDNGAIANEGWYIEGFTPSADNLWFSEAEVNKDIMYKGSEFYGTANSPLSGQNEVVVEVPSLKEGTASGYYGARVNSENLRYFGGILRFYIAPFKVEYKSVNGTVSQATEYVDAAGNPTGSVNTPSNGYYFIKWTVNKDITLKDGTVIKKGNTLTEDQIKNAVITEDVAFTAQNNPLLNVTYKWDGEHPDKAIPSGKSNIVPGSSYTVDATYKVGDKVEGTKDGRTGIWTFKGWDKSGDITINEDIVIKGMWSFTPNCTVSYEWEGEHPSKAVPKGATLKLGSTYTIDTTYKAGDKVKEGGGTWTFNGWDENGTIQVNEDKVIKGRWTFVPEYNITTQAENGTITPSEKDIPKGQNRTVSYTPNEGYQLKTLTVDGKDVNIKDYPASYTFSDISANHNVKAVFEKIPALAIEKTSDKSIYNAGDTVTYTIKVMQTVEGAEARNVTVNDTLPEGLTLNKDSFKGDVKVVKVGDNSYEIAIDSVKTELTYTYEAMTTKDADKEELVNIADVACDNSESTAKDDASVKSLTPKPVIEKIVSNENPVSGEEITYTISVKEPQEGIALRNAVITDSLPEGLEAESDAIIDGNEATAKFNSNTLTVNIPILETETVVTFTARVTAIDGSIDNIATLNGDGIEEIQDNAIIEVKTPTPTINKSVSKEKASIGDILTYTITASSDIELVNAVIVDKIPDGLKIVDAGGLEVSGNTLTAKFETLKDEIQIKYTAKVEKEGSHINIATLSAENLPEAIKDDVSVEGFIPTPKIEKSVDKEKVKAGDIVTYTIKASANGTIYNAVITDKLPSGVEIDKDSIKTNGEISISGQTLAIKFKALEDETITYKAVAKRSSKNIATLTGDGVSEVKAEADVTVLENSPKTGDYTQMPFALFAITFIALMLMLRKRFN